MELIGPLLSTMATSPVYLSSFSKYQEIDIRLMRLLLSTTAFIINVIVVALHILTVLSHGAFIFVAQHIHLKNE